MDERGRFWNDSHNTVTDRLSNENGLRVMEDLNRWVGSEVRVCTTDAFEDPGEHENGRSVVDFYAEANT